MIKALTLLLAFIGCLIGAPSRAAEVSGQPWPARAMTLMTPAPPGGAVDSVARVLADRLAARLHQPVVVDGKPGADGLVAADAFLAANDVQHTFLVTFGGLLVSNPVMHRNLRYDPLVDFVPVGMVAADTIVICANTALAATTLEQLFALMNERPGAVRWASAPGEPQIRFGGALARRHLSALFVPYKSNSQAVTDLLAGQIDVMAVPLASVLGNIRAGRLRALATMAPHRAEELRDVPTASESRVAELAMVPFIGMFARRGVSPAVVQRMNAEVNLILSDPAVSATLAAKGLHATPGSPASLAQIVKAKLAENRELATAGAHE